MHYMIATMLLVGGFIFGKLVPYSTEDNEKKYDRKLLIVAVFFFVFGSKTEVFRINDFSGMLSNLLSPFLFGVLIRRYIDSHFFKVHKEKE
jgi:hypothetical protein